MSIPENKGQISRYSDADLEVFKTLIEGKLETANEQVEQLESQALELSESLQANGYDIDENHAYSDVEFLKSQVIRQKKHIVDLENALRRIKNKNYGICTLTGTLIDKRRLMAVPTTSKSLLAKNEEALKAQQVGKPVVKKPASSVPTKPKQFTKIIKKPSEIKPAVNLADLDDDDDDDLDTDLDDLELDELDGDFEELVQDDD